MLAKKCDRCGALYEHYTGKSSGFADNANALMLMDRDLQEKYRERETFDLCPGCMEQLEAFLHGVDA